MEMTTERKAVLAKIKFPVRWDNDSIVFLDAKDDEIFEILQHHELDIIAHMIADSLNSQFANQDKETPMTDEVKLSALERHRRVWSGKSDEWLFERLDNELKQKVEEIHRLLAENTSPDLSARVVETIQTEIREGEYLLTQTCDKELRIYRNEFLRGLRRAISIIQSMSQSHESTKEKSNGH